MAKRPSCLHFNTGSPNPFCVGTDSGFRGRHPSNSIYPVGNERLLPDRVCKVCVADITIRLVKDTRVDVFLQLTDNTNNIRWRIRTVRTAVVSRANDVLSVSGANVVQFPNITLSYRPLNGARPK